MDTITTTIRNTNPASRNQAQKASMASRRRLREHVAGAFRRMAHGVSGRTAWSSTVAFYRSGGQEWAKQLG